MPLPLVRPPVHFIEHIRVCSMIRSDHSPAQNLYDFRTDRLHLQTVSLAMDLHLTNEAFLVSTIWSNFNAQKLLQIDLSFLPGLEGVNTNEIPKL